MRGWLRDPELGSTIAKTRRRNSASTCSTGHAGSLKLTIVAIVADGVRSSTPGRSDSNAWSRSPADPTLENPVQADVHLQPAHAPSEADQLRTGDRHPGSCGAAPKPNCGHVFRAEQPAIGAEHQRVGFDVGDGDRDGADSE